MSSPIRSLRSRRRPRKRAIALVVTVLLIAAASAIAYVAADAALSNTFSEATRSQTRTADSEARAAVAQIEGLLAGDPELFLNQVLPDEPDRYCFTGPQAGQYFAPGATWPATCGSRWSYAAAPQGWQGVRTELVAPTASQPGLKVISRSSVSDVEVRLDGVFAATSAARWTFASTGAVDVSDLGASSTISLTGGLYGNAVSGNPALSLSKAIEAGETLSGAVIDPNVSYFSTTPQAGPPAIGDIRTVQASPITSASLRASLEVSTSVACPNAPATNFSDFSTSKICITPGGVLRNSTGQDVTVPLAARSFMLAPTETGRFRIYYSTTSPDLSPSSPLYCTTALSCTQGTVASAFANDTHPGEQSFWTPGYLGELFAPLNGVIAVAGDTYIGVCSDAANEFLNSAVCAGGGSTFSSSITIVAGSTAAPADLVLGESVLSANNARVALAATGQVVIPYFARPATRPLTVDSHLLGLGDTGSGYATGILGYPDIRTTGPHNWTNATFTGSVTGTDLTLGISGLSSIAYAPAAASQNTPPPWFFGTAPGWSEVSTTYAISGSGAEDVPGTLITPPQNVTATAGVASVAVAWSPVDIFPPADGYRVYWTSAASPTPTLGCQTPGATCTVTGLTNGTQYTFAVVAHRADIEGPESDPATATPRTVPDAPTNVTATAGLAQASLSWTAPAFNGGADITDYAIQYSSNNGVSWATFPDAVSPSTTATVTGLSGGTSYIFRAAATNVAGTGAWSANSNSAIPFTVPGAPTNVSGSPSGTQVSLTWLAPVATGGSPITDYSVQYSSNNGSTWTAFADGVSTTRSATVTGLVRATSYVFRVAAINTAGTGPWSAQSPAYTTAPNAPSVSGGCDPGGGIYNGDTTGRCSFSWSASTATYYNGSFTNAAGGVTTIGNTTTTSNYGPLQGYMGTNSVSVRACNGAGCSGYSSLSATAWPKPTGTNITNAGGCGTAVQGGYVCLFRTQASWAQVYHVRMPNIHASTTYSCTNGCYGGGPAGIWYSNTWYSANGGDIGFAAIVTDTATGGGTYSVWSPQFVPSYYGINSWMYSKPGNRYYCWPADYGTWGRCDAEIVSYQ